MINTSFNFVSTIEENVKNYYNGILTLAEMQSYNTYACISAIEEGNDKNEVMSLLLKIMKEQT